MNAICSFCKIEKGKEFCTLCRKTVCGDKCKEIKIHNDEHENFRKSYKLEQKKEETLRIIGLKTDYNLPTIEKRKVLPFPGPISGNIPVNLHIIEEKHKKDLYGPLFHQIATNNFLYYFVFLDEAYDVMSYFTCDQHKELSNSEFNQTPEVLIKQQKDYMKNKNKKEK